MNRFAIAQPKTYEEAAGLLVEKRYTLPMLKAGGMDVLDHLKEGLVEPDVLIDVRRLSAGKQPVSGEGALIRIEAGATLAQIAGSEVIRQAAPGLAQACESAATPQVRNVASAAGNLMQRPRCWYYRNDQFECLKKGGPTCFAVEGENKYHAIFGDGPCHIVHPSNLAPALLVLGGEVHLVGGKREKLAVSELYHMPDKGVRTEANLEQGEVITHITFRAAPKSGFYSVKEKQSFDWPLVAAAAALELAGDTIKSARVCAAAVAPVPWALPNVEKALAGLSVNDESALKRACDVAVEGAKPMSRNAYKTKLLPVAVRRAVMRAAGMLREELA